MVMHNKAQGHPAQHLLGSKADIFCVGGEAKRVRVASDSTPKS